MVIAEQEKNIIELIRTHKLANAVKLAKLHGLEALAAKRIEVLVGNEVKRACDAFFQISNFDPSVWRLDNLVMDQDMTLDACEAALKELGERSKEAYHAVREHRKSFARSCSDYGKLARLEREDGNIEAAIRIYKGQSRNGNISIWNIIAELEMARTDAGDTKRSSEKIWQEAMEFYEQQNDYLSAFLIAHFQQLDHKVEHYRQILHKAGTPEISSLEDALRYALFKGPWDMKKETLEGLLGKKVHPFFGLLVDESRYKYERSPQNIERICGLLDAEPRVLDAYEAIAKELKGEEEQLPELFLEHLFSFEPVLTSDPIDDEKVKKDIAALRENIVPQKRGTILQRLIQRDVLHPFFDYVLARMEQFAEPKKAEDFIFSALSLDNGKLERYLTALRRTEKNGTPDPRFFDYVMDSSTGNFHTNYESLSSAVLAEASYLMVNGTLAEKRYANWYFNEREDGLKKKFKSNIDRILLLFEQMYTQSKVDAFKNNKKFKEDATRIITGIWADRQRQSLGDVVVETLTKFDFLKFFHQDTPIKNYLSDTEKRGKETRILFEDKADMVLEAILSHHYYDSSLGEEFEQSISTLHDGLRTSWDFDELKIEFNQNRLNNLFNKVNDCLTKGKKYQNYACYLMQDRNTNILVANIYQKGKLVGTVGKAYLIRCNGPILYVDGIVMHQEVADLLKEPGKEADWMPMFTRGVLMTALEKGIPEIIVNASHNDTQRSSWQYIHHFAELCGLQKERDFTFRIHKTKNQTTSEYGFKLGNNVLHQHLHYIERMQDGSYNGDHFLAGFWFNYNDPRQQDPEKKWSEMPPSIPLIEHRNSPHINPGKGYIIGFRRTTAELVRLFNKKYGEEYGHVPVTEV